MYVTRDNKNNIKGLFAAKQYEGQEIISENHPDVKAFRDRNNETPEEEKIRKEVRKLAIKSLKDKGELPPDYDENKTK